MQNRIAERFYPRLLQARAAFFVGATLIAIPPANAQSPTERLVDFHIPGQTLASALAAFEKETGWQISFDLSLVDGGQSAQVSGAMVPSDALRTLIANSNIGVAAVGPNEVRLVHTDGSGSKDVPDTPGLGVDENSTVLQAIVVQGKGAATEGSNSYTTGQMGTATGLPLSIRETPQSVSVVTRQQMDDQDARSFTEVLRTTNGMAENKLDTERSTFTYRGFTVDSYQYDGVPTTTSGPAAAGESDLDSIIYDRIEIVRGATGLLTGAGSPGAAIDLVRKRAASEILTGEVSASAGSWDNYRSTVDVSTPVNDAGTVRARFVGAGLVGNSFIDRYERKRGVLYGTVEADISDDTLLRLGADYQANRPEASTWGGALGTGWDHSGVEIDWPRAFNGAPDWARWDSTTQTQFANLEHTFENGWEGKIGYTHSRQAYDAKLAMSIGSYNPQQGWYDGYRDQNAINADLNGEFDLFGRTHELVIGASSSWQRNYGTLRKPLSTAIFPGTVPEWTGNVAEPSWGSKVKWTDFDVRQSGVFGAVRLSLADPLKVILGARYNNYRNDQTETYNSVSPYIGVVYDLSDSVSLYASYADIYQPQTSQDRNGGFLDPMTGTSYELGAKGSFFAERLNVTASMFWIKRDNFAEIDVGHLVPGSSAQAYNAVDGTESKGFELEVDGEILPDWNLSAGYAHFDLKDRFGTELNTMLPRDTFNMFTTYRFSGALEGLTVGGGVKWQTGISAVVKGMNSSGVFVSRSAEQDAFAITNLMARYDFTDDTSLQVNVNNLFDEKYYSQISFYNTRSYGEPRSFTVKLSHRF